MKWLSLPLALLALLVSAPALAQVGFEADCAGEPIAIPAGMELVVDSDLFSSCGVRAISSGGLMRKPTLVRPMPEVPGVTGEIALLGPRKTAGAPGSGDIVIVFAQAVRDVSFDVLGIAAADALEVVVTGKDDAVLHTARPVPLNQQVRFEHSAVQAILSVTVRYEPPTDDAEPDLWYLDRLNFTKTGSCGDTVVDPAAGEQCDDGNTVRCDGCDNDCRSNKPGCFDGTRCIEPETAGGCTFCDLSRAPAESGEILASPRPSSTVCDDDLFCTLAGLCDGAGKCVTKPNPCEDGAACTTDSCDEAGNTCVHVPSANFCFIGEACVMNGEAHPTDPCKFCNSAAQASAWSLRESGFQCGDPSCMNDRETAAARCTATGACEAGEPRACDGGRCIGQSCDGTCSEERPCARSHYCDPESQKCVPDRRLGERCTAGGECAEDHCVDGVCCEQACQGACEACGADGLCEPLAPMTMDPENRCGATLCGPDGLCLSPSSHGSRCSSDATCAGGHCVGGVCCDRPCDGGCEACDLPGNVGLCTPYAAGLDPKRACGTAGVCDGAGACATYEARGNGLCASAPLGGSDKRAPGSMALVALGLALALRRVRSRRRP